MEPAEVHPFRSMQKYAVLEHRFEGRVEWTPVDGGNGRSSQPPFAPGDRHSLHAELMLQQSGSLDI